MASASSCDGGAHDVGDAAVVAEVDHLRAVRLQQAADHVDGGVVAVEQRGGGDEAQRRPRRPTRCCGRAALLLRPAFMVRALACGSVVRMIDGRTFTRR